MKTDAKEILRWSAIVAFGGFGIWQTISGSHHVLTHPQGGGIETSLALGFIALVCTPFYIVAYICFRRHYRKLFDVLTVVGAVLVFGLLTTLPREWHIPEFFMQRGPWFGLRAFLSLPVSLLWLFGPFYAAAWVFRRCHRMAEPR